MSMSLSDPAAGNWHLDKRVPIALIFALAVQSGTAIWWAATTTGRISSVESLVQSSVTNRLNRIEDKLDRLIENRAEHPFGNIP
jgi:hypothetical protein